LRIAILSRHYPEYCFRYAEALARRAQVLLVLDRAAALREWNTAVPAGNPDFTVVYTDLSPKRGPLALLSALNRVRAFKPDFVHFQELPQAVTPLLMIALKPFTRLVLTVHDPAPHSGADSSHPKPLMRLLEFARSISHLLVVHGTFCEKVMRQHRPDLEARVLRSRHGILMASANPDGAAGKPYALFFGRMHKYKGLQELIAASDILTARGVEHKILVAGNGPEGDRLGPLMAVRPAIEPHIRFVSAEEARKLFRECRFVVMPYLDATQSGVAASAFGNGKALVASRVGGLPEIVHHGVNGLLTTPGDVTELADALQRLFEDEGLLAELSAGARRSAETELNWDGIADDIFDRFSHALAASSGQPLAAKRDA